MGCGVGAQTLPLAELASGAIVALDGQAPWIAQFERTVRVRGFSHRSRARADARPFAGSTTPFPACAALLSLPLARPHVSQVNRPEAQFEGGRFRTQSIVVPGRIDE